MTWPQWVIMLGMVGHVILVIIRSTNLVRRKQTSAGVAALNVIIGLGASVGYAFVLRAGGFW